MSIESLPEAASSSCAAREEEILCIWRLCDELPQPALLRRRWPVFPAVEGETDRLSISLSPSLSDMTVDSWELHWWGCSWSIGTGARRVLELWLVEPVYHGCCCCCCCCCFCFCEKLPESPPRAAQAGDAPKLIKIGAARKAGVGSWLVMTDEMLLRDCRDPARARRFSRDRCL